MAQNYDMNDYLRGSSWKRFRAEDAPSVKNYRFGRRSRKQLDEMEGDALPHTERSKGTQSRTVTVGPELDATK